MDKLTIKNMELYGYHGVHESERINGQSFFIDAEMKVKLFRACATDKLEDTVDYTKVYDIITNINECNKFRLIEKFADRICREILFRFENVQEITVRVRKPDAPMEGEFDYVEVEMKRGRND